MRNTHPAYDLAKQGDFWSTTNSQCFLSPAPTHALSPPTPYTSPLKATGHHTVVTNTPKRPCQRSLDLPRRRRHPQSDLPSLHLMLPVEMWASWHYLHTHPNILQEPDKSRVQGCTSPQSIHCTFRITQLKRSTLHFEKCLVSQRIEECKMTLEALEDRMLELEEGIVHSTHTVGNMHLLWTKSASSFPMCQST